ncbi:HD domain-containing protein [Methanosarcina horonobensis]|uniref:HD domain-containing protein n=1 Tax=Methanosarcina horonobensis TaxID=418008 RepID=UPI000AA02BAF|nr:ATP-binding protein [Methanosarcina horonobensis]
MSEDAILRLHQTGLFNKLLEKENEEKKSTSIEDHEISQNIISVVRKAAPLLERIPINMPEFTLHNANHSIHVIKNIEDLIPPETLEQLNAVEISILIYAAYLHDIGMISSSDERKQIVKTNEFKKLLNSNEELYEKLEKAKNNGDYQAVLEIENKAFTDFLRKNHVEHAHKIIKEYELDSEISWKGTSYYKWVKAVCDSHGLPVKELKKNDNWPIDVLVRNKPVNVQYLSLILRLADILDLDSERTPKRLFYHINPKDKISIQEWEKHLSITGFRIGPEEIKVEAECKSPNCERVLRKFIKDIDKELEESNYLISSYRADFAKYRLNLSESVNVRIHSIGYEYRDFRFELDYRRVLDLLMGEGLYGNPVVALRELLQNSVDAVRYRESLEKREGNGYRPSIEVSLTNDELIVEDNGIGMDEEIFKNYFMKVGRSYYQSSDFREKNVDIDPVSEFGIGILSVFMVADKFTVESRRKTFEDELNPYISIYFEIPTAYDYFVKRQSKRSKYGTKIILNLKSDHPFSPSSLIEKKYQKLLLLLNIK